MATAWRIDGSAGLRGYAVGVPKPNDTPGDALTPLQMAATQAHEHFLAFTSAGFTEDQALRLVALQIGEAQRGRS